MMNEEGGVNHE